VSNDTQETQWTNAMPKAPAMGPAIPAGTIRGKTGEQIRLELTQLRGEVASLTQDIRQLQKILGEIGQPDPVGRQPKPKKLE